MESVRSRLSGVCLKRCVCVKWAQTVCWDIAMALVLETKSILIYSLCGTGFPIAWHLSHCSVAVKRQHDQGKSYKSKRLTGGLLTVLEGQSTIVMAGSRQAQCYSSG